jgi:hypothetical protein
VVPDQAAATVAPVAVAPVAVAPVVAAPVVAGLVAMDQAAVGPAVTGQAAVAPVVARGRRIRGAMERAGAGASAFAPFWLSPAAVSTGALLAFVFARPVSGFLEELVPRVVREGVYWPLYRGV